MNPVLKSGLISGSLSLAGDLVAQILTNRSLDGNNSRGQSYDATRALRMGSFGLFFYGPYQHYWYQALDRAFSARTLQNFASKVALNQVCLAPVVITGVFAWNLALQGALSDLPGKLRRDFMPTIMTGWKFWVPAATINFVAVPLQHQVLYMSACGVIWTAFLSYSSSVSEKAQLK
jgi:protein Mpv17